MYTYSEKKTRQEVLHAKPSGNVLKRQIIRDFFAKLFTVYI